MLYWIVNYPRFTDQKGASVKTPSFSLTFLVLFVAATVGVLVAIGTKKYSLGLAAAISLVSVMVMLFTVIASQTRNGEFLLKILRIIDRQR